MLDNQSCGALHKPTMSGATSAMAQDPPDGPNKQPGAVHVVKSDNLNDVAFVLVSIIVV